MNRLVENISLFGLNILGLELAIQCALEVESWFPGCNAFALDCGIDSVHSYKAKNGGNAFHRRRFYWGRKTQKKCQVCGADALIDSTRCQKHAYDLIVYSRAHKEKLKSKGLCQDCGSKAVDGKTRCAKHLAAKNKRRMELYYKRKAAGV